MTQFWGRAKYELAADLHRRQHGKCAYCPDILTVQKMTLDHVMPLAVGGADERENIVLACEPCNHTKGNRLPTLEEDAYRRWVHRTPLVITR